MSDRRTFLGIAGRIAVAGAVLPIAAPAEGVAVMAMPSELSAPDHPDAILLAACAAFDALEMQHAATFGNRMADDPAELEAVAERLRLYAAQDPHVDIIFRTPALTVDGLRAKARTLCLWSPELLDRPSDREETLLLALLRDLQTVRATPILPGAA